MIKALNQDVLGQINANEHHLADALFAFGPIRPEVAAHQLVHALEDHLLLGALHIQHAFVAQHLGAIDVDDGAQKVFQFGGVKLALGLVHKALHVIVMVVVMAVVAVLVMHMVMVMVAMRVVMAVVMCMVVLVRGMVAVLAVVVMVIVRQDVGVNVELGIQVEAAQVKHFAQRHFTEVRHFLWGAWVHVLQTVLQGIQLSG